VTLKYFFSAQNQVPLALQLSSFGTAHLLWLLAISVGIVVVCVYYRSLSIKKRRTFLKWFTLIMVSTELLRDLTYVALGTFQVGYLPFHLCGVTEILAVIYVFSHNRLSREVTYCLTLPGALASLLFADWLNLPLLHFQSIQSFIGHGMLIAFTMMLLTSGEHRPDYKWLPKCFGLLVVTGIPLYFLNKVWGTNFYFVNFPSPGSPLVLFEQWAGNPGYIAVTAVLIIVVWAILYVPWIVADAYKTKKSVH